MFFGKRNSGKGRKTAAAFIDFEHWCYSLSNNFSVRPDIRSFYKTISEKYDLRDITFFGDFSNPVLRQEIPRIREVTSNIIETQNASAHFKKDFTDFIMLDHIYQRSFYDDIDVFILFTGDGHFSSVVSYLVNKRHKEVEIFGVENAVSSALRNTATQTTTVPSEEEMVKGRRKRILQTLSKMYAASESPRPTFVKTVQAVAKEADCPEDLIASALESLIADGYVYQTKKYFSGGKFIKVLALNNQLIKNDRILES